MTWARAPSLPFPNFSRPGSWEPEKLAFGGAAEVPALGPEQHWHPPLSGDGISVPPTPIGLNFFPAREERDHHQHRNTVNVTE